MNGTRLGVFDAWPPSYLLDGPWWRESTGHEQGLPLNIILGNYGFGNGL